MGFATSGRMIVTRWAKTRASDIQQFADMHVDDELVLHLRYRTSGAADAHNLQPFEIVPGLFLDAQRRGRCRDGRPTAPTPAPGHRPLRPPLDRHQGLALDRSFRASLNRASGRRTA
ncbi:MAG: hypothetical protein IPG64_14800 [Haliea sp.]|nr:hypothetical protein [Haliea sp.]